MKKTFTELLDELDYSIDLEEEDRIDFNISFESDEKRKEFNTLYDETEADQFMTDLICKEFEKQNKQIPEFSNLRWDSTVDEMLGIFAEDARYDIIE